ncbi:hypothetical protein [Thioflexithrix psekupsensis]|uniref:Phosphoglycerate mutase n=1 Tax=Thioflexithrix psekupsensis TaxID=1570016 RepID=A0A251X604_9GAMM|nr:hypothetical protein [Thioflexithrix psekupsensis]OUD13093.1 hypothetical protein TPSD3_10615 [Thioflexithrix psekupsensis]
MIFPFSFKTHSDAPLILHWVISDLFIPETEALSQIRLPALEQLLSRAYIEPWPADDFFATISRLFDLNYQELPIAAVTRLDDKGDCENFYWLRADPVYLKADQDRLLLFDIDETFALEQAHADQLTQELTHYFTEENFIFSAVTPTRWYLRLNQDPEIQTTPLTRLIGNHIEPGMPKGKNARFWRKYFNEIQMLLHRSPINAQREMQGLLPINSVWFWGAGKIPTLTARPWVGVWSEDVLVRGLAQLSHTPVHPVPNNAKTGLAQLTAPGEYLLTTPAPCRSLDEYTNALHHLDQAWAAPLLSALKQGVIDTLLIYPCRARVFCLTRQRARHWWRKQQHWQQLSG